MIALTTPEGHWTSRFGVIIFPRQKGEGEITCLDLPGATTILEICSFVELSYPELNLLYPGLQTL